MKHTCQATRLLSAVALLLSLTASVSTAQSALTYVYDDLGRLSKTIASTGECSIYRYDAVGNVAGIERQANCSSAPIVSVISPGSSANCFVATGQSLSAATVTVDTTGVSVFGLQGNDSALNFCLRPQAIVCSLSVSVTISTLAGSSSPFPLTLAGAASLTPGQAVGGAVSAAGERDQFCFSAGGLERIIIQATSADVNACVAVTTAAGAAVPNGSACVSSILTGTARVDLVLGAGDYRIDVFDNGNNHTGAYTLIYEPLISSAAAPLVPDAPVTRFLDVTGDLDLFSFTLASATRVVVQATSFDINACMRVMTAPGGPAVPGGGFGCVSTLFTGSTRFEQVLDAGTYFVEISDNGNNHTGNYTLVYEPVIGSNAVSLSADEPANHAIDHVGDLDLYSFSLTVPTRVALQATSPAINSCIRVLTPAGVPVPSGGFGCVSTIFTGAVRLDLVLEPGTYFVEVSDNADNHTGPYSLLYEPVTLSNAVPLVPDVPATGNVGPAGDLDFYSFALTEPTRVVLQATSSAINACIRVLTPAGVAPVSGGFACVSTIFSGAVKLDLVLPPGTYFVELSDNGQDHTGDYTLFYEPVVTGNARLIAAGTPAADALTPVGDLDLYAFTLADVTRVVVDASSTTINACVRVLTATTTNGPACVSTIFTGTARLEALLQPGTYFIEVSDNANDNAGSYTLSLETDEASVPTVTVVATDPDASELGPDSGTFTIARTGATTAALVVDFTIDGTAINASDYQFMFPSVTIPPGQASWTVTVNPLADSQAEDTETVVLTLRPGQYRIGPASSDIVSIADGAPTVTVQATDPDAAEAGPDTGTFTVTRTGSTQSALPVFFAMSGAIRGSDYALSTGSSSSVLIPAGQASAVITVTPILDAVLEGDESVVLTLGAGGYHIGTASTASVVIADHRPTVTVETLDATASEADGSTARFVVTRTGPTGVNLVVNFILAGTAESGSDYRTTDDNGLGLPGSVAIIAGQSSAAVVVAPLLDALLEEDETVILTLADGPYSIGAADTATAMLSDSGTTVTIEALDADASEIAPATGTFRVSRSGPLGVALPINITVTGTAARIFDYTLALPNGSTLFSTINLNAGQASTTLTVTPILDTLLEGDETVVLTLDPGGYIVGTPNSASVTIADNVPIVTLQATDADASEFGPDTGAFTVTRTGPTGVALPVSLSRSGTAGTSDYQFIPATVSIPSGQTSATITVTPVLDAVAEAAETLTLTLASGSYTVGTPSSGTVTIADAVPPTFVSVFAQDPEAYEIGDTGAFIVTRSGPTAADLPVSITLAGTATNGTDYQTIGSTVTIPAGQASAVVTVTPLADTLDEGSETVTLTIGPGEYQIQAFSESAELSIFDGAPLALVYVIAEDPTAFEIGADAASFFVGRVGVTVVPLTVNLSLGGSAAEGTDYATIGSSVEIPAGASFVRVTVTPVSDALDEGIESVVLTLEPGAGYDLLTGNEAAEVTISDGAQPATVYVLTSDATGFEEGPDSAAITFFRTGDTSGNLTVNYTVGGTAASGADYVPLSGSVVIPAGLSFAVVKVTPVLDTAAEGQETVTLTIAPGAYGTIPVLGTATVTIDDGPAPMAVALFVSDATAYEAGGDPATVTVTRTGPTDTNVTVNFTVSGTTAEADYLPIGSSVVIAAGQTQTQIVVTPVNDALTEGAETVVITLAAGAYTVASATPATVTINDGTSPTIVSVALTVAGAVYEQGNQPGAVFTISRTGPVANPLSVNLGVSGTAIPGADYLAIPATVTIPAGESLALAAVVPLPDALAEGLETVTLTIAPGAYAIAPSGQNSSTVSIADGAAPPQVTQVYVSSPDSIALEDGADSASFIISRFASPADNPVTVNFALTGPAGNGTDYQAVPSSVTIPAGSLGVVVPITPVDDDVAEGRESVTLTLTPGSYTVYGLLDSASVTIADGSGDVPNFVYVTALDPLASENGDPATFVVGRMGPTDVALAVSLEQGGTASAGVDYQPLGSTVVIPAGQAFITVTVTPVADSSAESAETVRLTILPGPYTVHQTAATAVVGIADSAP